MQQLFALVLLMILCALEPASAQTGATFLEHCSLAVRQSDGEKLNDLETFKASVCISYVSGFLDATGIIHSARPQTQVLCLPVDGITNDQAVRIFVKHLRSAPETLHQSGRISLLVALAKAFPCSK